MNLPIILGIGGALGLTFMLAGRRYKENIVTINGRKWIVRKTSFLKPPDAEYNVLSPAMQFGPHAEMSVLHFTQTGDDPASRKLSSYGLAPPSVISAAVTDFGIKVPVKDVSGKSGYKWILEKTAQVGVKGTYMVSSPAGQFGPHVKMPIFTFTSVGDDPATRKLLHRYPGVPPKVYASALSDFLVKE